MDKVLQLIGICMKSRHLICGTDSVINNLQKNKLHLIILSTDASDNLKDKLIKKAYYYNVPIIQKYDMKTISSITKKKNIVYGIDDIGLSNAVKCEIEKEA